LPSTVVKLRYSASLTLLSWKSVNRNSLHNIYIFRHCQYSVTNCGENRGPYVGGLTELVKWFWTLYVIKSRSPLWRCIIWGSPERKGRDRQILNPPSLVTYNRTMEWSWIQWEELYIFWPFYAFLSWTVKTSLFTVLVSTWRLWEW